MTWDGSNTISTLNDVLQATINTYDGATGYPSKVTIDGWSPIDYSWNANGTMATKTFQGFLTSYTYHTGTKLLNTITSVDQTSVSYTFDDLLRLKTMTDNCRGVTTTLDYFYGSPTTGGNYIRNTTDYPTATNSALDILRTRQFFDGLGLSLIHISEPTRPY